MLYTSRAGPAFFRVGGENLSQFLVGIVDIEGESTVPNYEAQIECFALRHVIDLPVVAGRVRVDGMSTHGMIQLVHAIDKSTPRLRLAACLRSNLGNVVITRMAVLGGQPRPVEIIGLHNALIHRIDTDMYFDHSIGEPSDEPFETFSLEYSDIVWRYHKYLNGLEAGRIEGGWSTALQSTDVAPNF